MSKEQELKKQNKYLLKRIEELKRMACKDIINEIPSDHLLRIGFKEGYEQNNFSQEQRRKEGRQEREKEIIEDLRKGINKIVCQASGDIAYPDLMKVIKQIKEAKE